MRIFDRRVTVLRNQVVRQVKVQWEHYSPNESTWELEDAMRLAHPFLFISMEYWGNTIVAFCSILYSTEDSAIEGGGECNTLVLNPFALNVYDVYIVINHGVELQEKAPPWIIVLCFDD